MKRFETAHGTIDYCIEDYDNSILYIDFIESYVKRSGHGINLMRDFLVHVQDMPVSKVNLIACESYGVPVDSLVKFYRSFGFNVLERSHFGVTMEKIL
jgi:hypothetical protein